MTYTSSVKTLKEKEKRADRFARLVANSVQQGRQPRPIAAALISVLFQFLSSEINHLPTIPIFAS